MYGAAFNMWAQLKQAKAYQQMRRITMASQIDATERAKVEMLYRWYLPAAEMRKIDGRGIAAVWGKTRIPQVARENL